MPGEGPHPERGTSSSGMADPDAQLKRIERLEARLELQRDLALHALDEQTVRFAQSVGVVIEYRTARGQVDREDLRRHIERSFHIVDASEPAEPAMGPPTGHWLRTSRTPLTGPGVDR